MYFNDVHILMYVAIAELGVLVSLFIKWCNVRLPENKKIFSKDIKTQYKNSVGANYIIMAFIPLCYIFLLYKFGLKNNLIENLELIKYLILIPMLISVFIIDYKLQIIPNRLNLTMFEVGLVFTFLYGVSNINIAINMLLGMLVGGGIFLFITLIGGMIAGKEAMGFGDVKLMGALGLFFGVSNIIVITLISFLIGAIISIILLITRKKKTDEYIPFGPFIVIASFVVMFVPFSVILISLLKIFTLGMYN